MSDKALEADARAIWEAVYAPDKSHHYFKFFLDGWKAGAEITEHHHAAQPSDYTELVADLRLQEVGPMRDAADAIEALEAKVEWCSSTYNVSTDELEEMEQRAEAAEARVAELEEALNNIKKLRPERVAEGFITGPAALIAQAKAIARAALKAESPK